MPKTLRMLSRGPPVYDRSRKLNTDSRLFASGHLSPTVDRLLRSASTHGILFVRAIKGLHFALDWQGACFQRTKCWPRRQASNDYAGPENH